MPGSSTMRTGSSASVFTSFTAVAPKPSAWTRRRYEPAFSPRISKRPSALVAMRPRPSTMSCIELPMVMMEMFSRNAEMRAPSIGLPTES